MNILTKIDKYEEISLKKLKLIYTIKEESSYDYTRKILLLKDGRLATISQATDIKIYGASVKFPLEILIENAHKNAINSLSELYTGELVSCSGSGSIKL